MNLTLLAGIMCGYQYDVRVMSSIDLHITHGIVNRDREATHMHCAKRAVGHHGERVSYWVLLDMSLPVTCSTLATTAPLQICALG